MKKKLFDYLCQDQDKRPIRLRRFYCHCLYRIDLKMVEYNVRELSMIERNEIILQY